MIDYYFTGENIAGQVPSNTDIEVSNATYTYQSTQQSNVSLKQSDYFLNTFYQGKFSKHLGADIHFDYFKIKEFSIKMYPTKTLS